MQNRVNVTEHKFVCQMYSEAKQYRNVRVGAEKRFTAGPYIETGGLCPQNSELPEGFQQSTFLKKIG